MFSTFDTLQEAQAIHSDAVHQAAALSAQLMYDDTVTPPPQLSPEAQQARTRFCNRLRHTIQSQGRSLVCSDIPRWYKRVTGRAWRMDLEACGLPTKKPMSAIVAAFPDTFRQHTDHKSGRLSVVKAGVPPLCRNDAKGVCGYGTECHYTHRRAVQQGAGGGGGRGRAATTTTTTTTIVSEGGKTTTTTNRTTVRGGGGSGGGRSRGQGRQQRRQQRRKKQDRRRGQRPSRPQPAAPVAQAHAAAHVAAAVPVSGGGYTSGMVMDPHATHHGAIASGSQAATYVSGRSARAAPTAVVPPAAPAPVVLPQTLAPPPPPPPVHGSYGTRYGATQAHAFDEVDVSGVMHAQQRAMRSVSQDQADAEYAALLERQLQLEAELAALRASRAMPSASVAPRAVHSVGTTRSAASSHARALRTTPQPSRRASGLAQQRTATPQRLTHQRRAVPHGSHVPQRATPHDRSHVVSGHERVEAAGVSRAHRPVGSVVATPQRTSLAPGGGGQRLRTRSPSRSRRSRSRSRSRQPSTGRARSRGRYARDSAQPRASGGAGTTRQQHVQDDGGLDALLAQLQHAA